MERYHRQIILKEFGLEGQSKLLKARVLVVGAGGLGCSILPYLAAAGVGTLGIVDADIVSLSNLQRQVLYNMDDLGAAKSECAALKLQKMNPDVKVIPYQTRLTNSNALDILSSYDLVIDASDNFPTRYVINDACLLLHKPMVYGAVSQFEGQVAVFNVENSNGERSVNYRDLFPNPPAEGEIANCAEAGVLGTLPGIIGMLQATEAIKLITQIGRPLAGQLMSYNQLTNEWHTFELPALQQQQGNFPNTSEAFLAHNYELTCKMDEVLEIDLPTFQSLLKQNEVTIIDVREVYELPRLSTISTISIPLGELMQINDDLPGEILITVCQSGARSKSAVKELGRRFPNKKIYSLAGGIQAWQEQADFKLMPE